MLPDFLKSSYVSYKENTNSFVHWIVTNSRKHGFDPLSASSGGRLKGKARAAARKATATTEKGSESFKVSVPDLLQCVNVITSSATPEKLPKRIIAKALRAIKGRRSCTAWFAQNQPTQDQSNLTHSHFASVLEKALHHLLAPEERSVINATPPERQNRFDALEVEECLSEGEDWPISSVSTTSGDAECAEYTLEDPENPDLARDEAVFAMLCLLKDIEGVRTYLADLWNRYKEGCVDVFTCGFVTSAGIDLIGRVADEFTAKFPDYEDILSWPDLIIRVFLKNLGLKDFHKVKVYAALAGAHEDLRQVYIESGMRTLCYTGRTVKDTRREFETDEEKLLRQLGDGAGGDRERLLMFVSDFTLIGHANEDHTLCSDRFTRDLAVESERLSQAAQGGCQPVPHVSITLAFGVMIFLDVQKSLGDEIGRGYHDLCVLSKYVKSTLQSHVQFLTKENADDSITASFVAGATDTIRTLDKWVFSDQVYLTKKRFMELSSQWEPEKELGADAEGAHFMLKGHPVLCGMMGLSSLFAFHGLQTMVNYTYISANCAQLFSTVRHRSTNGWVDMDCFIDIHQNGPLLIDRKPRDSASALRRAALNRGISATQLAPGTRGTKHSASSNKRRATMVEATSFFTSEGGRQDLSKLLFQVERLIKQDKKTKAKSKGNSGYETTILSMENTLEYVEKVLSRDFYACLFDQGKFERTCTMLLRVIDRGVQTSSKDHHALSLGDVSTAFNALEQFAMCIMNTNAQCHDTLQVSSSQLFDIVATTFEKVASKHGSVIHNATMEVIQQMVPRDATVRAAIVSRLKEEEEEAEKRVVAFRELHGIQGNNTDKIGGPISSEDPQKANDTIPEEDEGVLQRFFHAFADNPEQMIIQMMQLAQNLK